MTAQTAQELLLIFATTAPIIATAIIKACEAAQEARTRRANKTTK